jgi:GNAT superfamily N-acetyltransferase
METQSGPSNVQLMDVHIDTLYRCDPDGRLRSVNELDGPTAPRFFMGRTPEGNRWRFRYDLPDALVRQLEPLCQAEPASADMMRLPQNYPAITAVLQAHAPIQDEYRGPAYWAPRASVVPDNVVLITETNAQLLQAGFAGMLPLPQHIDVGPIAAAIAQGMAVAICFCSRLPGQATEAGVETLEAFRGQGYATAAVAGWVAAIQQRGIIPLYGTTWTNYASQAVARKLGMVRYGEDWSIS